MVLITMDGREVRVGWMVKSLDERMQDGGQ